MRVLYIFLDDGPSIPLPFIMPLNTTMFISSRSTIPITQPAVYATDLSPNDNCAPASSVEVCNPQLVNGISPLQIRKKLLGNIVLCSLCSTESFRDKYPIY